MFSPEIIGAMSKSLGGPPRNLGTEIERGSRDESTCLIGISVKTTLDGVGISIPNVKRCCTFILSSIEKTNPMVASSTATARCINSSSKSGSGRSVFSARPTSYNASNCRSLRLSSKLLCGIPSPES